MSHDLCNFCQRFADAECGATFRLLPEKHETPVVKSADFFAAVDRAKLSRPLFAAAAQAHVAKLRVVDAATFKAASKKVFSEHGSLLHMLAESDKKKLTPARHWNSGCIAFVKAEGKAA